MSDEILVVLTTAPSREEGESLARALVEQRVAACVNVSARMRSFFRWKGEICTDDEVQLFIKTSAGSYEALVAAIRELHSYELPEIVAVPAVRVESEYASWVGSQLFGPPTTD